MTSIVTNIRPLETTDVPFGLRLSTEAGWNQTSADWRRFLGLAPRACFLALAGSEPLGTVTTCQFGSVGWIGMLLVSRQWRRRGIGKALLGRAMESLDRSGAATIRLDATEVGAPLYTDYGFLTDFRLHRFAGQAGFNEGIDAGLHVRNARAENLPIMSRLDQQVMGCDREPLLRALCSEKGVRSLIVEQQGSLRGFAVQRPGCHATFIGPCIATDASVGQGLLKAVLAGCRNQEILIDIPVSNEIAVGMAEAAGLRPAREFLRMSYGASNREDETALFASSGPEKG